MRLPKLLLRIFVSLGLLALAYAAVDMQQLWRVFTRMSLPGAVAIMLLFTAGQAASAVRWNIFVKEVGMQRTAAEIIRIYFFGMYVNTFGLGTVGGDFTRALLLRPSKGARAAALATVVADRLFGLLVLLSIGAVAVLLVKPPTLGAAAEGLSILAIVLIAACWIFGPRLLMRFFPEGSSHHAGAQAACLAFPKSPKRLLYAGGIAVFVHTVQILMYAVIARDLHTGLSLGYLFACVPLINVASSLPISINGIGIREAMYVLLFVPMGVTQETAVAFGAVWLLCVTIVSALGGLLLPPSVRGEFSETASRQAEAKEKAAA